MLKDKLLFIALTLASLLVLYFYWRIADFQYVTLRYSTVIQYFCEVFSIISYYKVYIPSAIQYGPCLVTLHIVISLC